MKYQICENNIDNIKTECLVMFTKEINQLNFNLNIVPSSLHLYMKEILDNSKFSGKYKETLFSYIPIKSSVKSLLIIGIGDPEKLSKKRFNNVLKLFLVSLKKFKFKNISIKTNDLCYLIDNEQDVSEKNYVYEEIVKHIAYDNYNFSKYKSC